MYRHPPKGDFLKMSDLKAKSFESHVSGNRRGFWSLSPPVRLAALRLCALPRSLLVHLTGHQARGLVHAKGNGLGVRRIH